MTSTSHRSGIGDAPCPPSTSFRRAPCPVASVPVPAFRRRSFGAGAAGASRVCGGFHHEVSSAPCRRSSSIQPRAVLDRLGNLFQTNPAEKTRQQHQEGVNAVNALEAEMSALDDQGLRQRTKELRERVAGGESLDDVLVEAFAVRDSSLGEGPPQIINSTDSFPLRRTVGVKHVILRQRQER